MIRTTTSGSVLSNNPIVGSMHFMKNGDVSLSLPDKDDIVSVQDKSALLITSEFLMYALERDDWMLEFLNSMNKSLKDLEKQNLRGKFRVIEGGLSKDTEDSKNT